MLIVLPYWYRKPTNGWRNTQNTTYTFFDWIVLRDFILKHTEHKTALWDVRVAKIV